MATTQIVKWGNSLAIRLPQPVAEEAGVGEGDPVVVEAVNRRIQLRTDKRRIPSLQELVAQIAPENRYAAVETGRARGHENVEW
jgi:antitoxin MazE